MGTNLVVADVLKRFVAEEVLPGLGLSEAVFWQGLDSLLTRFEPQNSALLARRDTLQRQIDAHYRERQGEPFDPAEHENFLRDIGYIQPAGPAFHIATANVDAEIATLAGPQLVVPVDNARYALNAANARWGSLYDALYGTDALVPIDRGIARDYDPVRGAMVIAWVRALLDDIIPLEGASHREVTAYRIEQGQMIALADGGDHPLRQPDQCVGYRGSEPHPTSLLFLHHGLHVELIVDRDHPIGRGDTAGIADVVLESAITTIMDCEDSVAAVDPAEKVVVYRNWLGLMKRDLRTEFQKDGRPFIRSLAPDRSYRRLGGGELTLPGLSLMLIRNVGMHMMTDAVSRDGKGVPEGLLDAMITAAIAKHDLKRPPGARNSAAGSIYIVKPKMHGAEEVAFCDAVFAAVEEALDLPPHTLKIGIMDEERRMSLNLHESIRAAAHRLVFINTGFLDRTGDEIHTMMEAGPVIRKNDIKASRWIAAYENQNVEIGLRTGLAGTAQIGKGMWAQPDRMADMLAQKMTQVEAGATTAWVPSPSAAVLHAIHYHRVDARACQSAVGDRAPASLADLLTIPLAAGKGWSAAEIQQELDNNIQGILGYVVRWIDQGIGCSKVPDIHDIGLMEDRATLRISSQHVANWLHHGVCTAEQVEATFRRMAAIVDAQNAGDPAYTPMTGEWPSNLALAAARDLVFQGRDQPNGYTEAILTARRRQRKAQRGLGA